MRAIPEPYLPPPPGITPAGLLVWVVRKQWTTVLQGVVCDIIWLLGLALTPWAIGRSIDEGLVAGDYAAFMLWLGVVVWLQLQHSLIQGLRDRAGSVNFERAASRIDQVITRAATRVTVAADSRTGAGSAVTMATNDAWAISFVPINVGTLLSSLVSYITVAVLVLRDSLLLGVLIVIVVPLFALIQLVLVSSLRSRQTAAREATWAMNTVASDSVRGLRVIRGVGGEAWFLDRFRSRSERSRDAEKRVAWPMSVADALAVLIAGVLVAGLTWIGAAMVARGELRVGELVAFYGYAGFMVIPVTLFNQVMRVAVRGMIGARAIVGLVGIDPLWPRRITARSATETATRRPSDEHRVVLTDEVTGVRLHEGEMLGVAIENSQEAQTFVNRIGRLASDGPERVFLDGTPLADLPVDAVRAQIVVSDPVPFLFSGTLREVLDPWRRHDDSAILSAMAAVDAVDVLAALDGGLDVLVGERGVEFSGGQRQRLGAARALLSETRVLVLSDPTSAVDASTEERMAAGIRAHRSGSATIVITTSPLVLSTVDRVVVVEAGVVRAEGRHEHLIASDADYRRRVLRAEGVA